MLKKDNKYFSSYVFGQRFNDMRSSQNDNHKSSSQDFENSLLLDVQKPMCIFPNVYHFFRYVTQMERNQLHF